MTEKMSDRLASNPPPVSETVFARYGIYRAAMRHILVTRLTDPNLPNDPRVDFLVDQLAFRMSRLVESILMRDEHDIMTQVNQMIELPFDFLTHVTARDYSERRGVTEHANRAPKR